MRSADEIPPVPDEGPWCSEEGCFHRSSPEHQVVLELPGQPAKRVGPPERFRRYQSRCPVHVDMLGPVFRYERVSPVYGED